MILAIADDEILIGLTADNLKRLPTEPIEIPQLKMRIVYGLTDKVLAEALSDRVTEDTETIDLTNEETE